HRHLDHHGVSTDLRDPDELRGTVPGPCRHDLPDRVLPRGLPLDLQRRRGPERPRQLTVAHRRRYHAVHGLHHHDGVGTDTHGGRAWSEDRAVHRAWHDALLRRDDPALHADPPPGPARLPLGTDP